MNVMCMSTYLNRIVIRDPFENEVLERESESEKNIAYFRPVFVRKTSLNVKNENENAYCQLKSLIRDEIVIFYTEILMRKDVLWSFFMSLMSEKSHNLTFQVKI